MTKGQMTKNCIEIFVECAKAVRRGELIRRESPKDKEFHFQNWFEARLHALKIAFDEPDRNTYPDFRLLNAPEGYETKGLGFPGREANYDSNSQVPSGRHHGRTIFYVFGRYPADPESNEYPVLDLVMCHGDFLNAHHDYRHKNASFTAFGSYGDIMIRDRKMYVAPTPFGLTDGTARHSTLILPADARTDTRLNAVGHLIRLETDELVTGYSFDMESNKLKPMFKPNPSAGKEHRFIAYRLSNDEGPVVTVRAKVARASQEDE